VGFFDRFKRAIGFKNKFVGKEIKAGEKLLAVVLLNDEERSLGKRDRIERFRQWSLEQASVGEG
jgi:hypothetical protein